MTHQHTPGHEGRGAHGIGDGSAPTQIAEVELDFCFCGTELASLERLATAQARGRRQPEKR